MTTNEYDIIEILEGLKQQANYAITMFYGEDIGCDDLGEKIPDRNITIVMFPVGYHGSLKKVWRGSLASLVSFDFKKERPQIASNPPTDEDARKQYYVFGSDEAIKSYSDKM